MINLVRPKYWEKKTWVSILLLPLSYVYYFVTWLKYLLSSPKSVNIPVICVGNIIVGGSGKTPLTIAIANYLVSKGTKVAIISRGFRGKLSSNQKSILVTNKHHAYEVGDEALLLAKVAPTYICKNRFIAAEHAKNDGAEVIIMDDGLQHYTLKKTFSILVFDPDYKLGNQLLLPAGPMRESLCIVKNKIDCVLYTGQVQKNLLPSLKVPQFTSKLKVINQEKFIGKSFIALCAIANPEKFFATLKSLKINIIKKFIFGDHHVYQLHEIEQVVNSATKENVKIITTSKDMIKIPKRFHNIVEVIDIEYILPDQFLNLISQYYL